MDRIYRYSVSEPIGDGVHWKMAGFGFMEIPYKDLVYLFGEPPELFYQSLDRAHTTLDEADIYIPEEGMILYDYIPSRMKMTSAKKK